MGDEGYYGIKKKKNKDKGEDKSEVIFYKMLVRIYVVQGIDNSVKLCPVYY